MQPPDPSLSVLSKPGGANSSPGSCLKAGPHVLRSKSAEAVEVHHEMELLTVAGTVSLIKLNPDKAKLFARR